ncbi:MAG: hypothetical protein IT211_02885 [Armatimonadetes bacterium]|nr:hypothetical protein [Armatimonadota bacterium]
MKKHLLILACILGIFSTATSQEYDTPNVLSYYAMGNSMDGQPMVDMANILRFYPVFALQQYTDAVIITIYYGPYVYTDTARPMNDKQYWESRLPRFELGQAIQRIDVRTSINQNNPITTSGLTFASIPSIDSAIYAQITDTNYSGVSVRKGDVIIDNPGYRIQILYRNHKTSLRELPALDPAENVGLFRARFIPFVIIGKDLLTTFTGGHGAVFEIGLAFGDVRVSGDDFIKPELSLRRLGVAFAVTNRLFSDDARIRALAFTYDFTSYGSIAAGVNFPGENSSSSMKNELYMSFGVNKRAFEQMLKKISGLF